MKLPILKYALCALALIVPPLAAWAGPLMTGTPQSFVFHDQGHFADKPITVHYYKPKNATVDSKVIFSIHGSERNGKRARDNWIGFSERHGLIVIAPEFDHERFPND